MWKIRKLPFFCRLAAGLGAVGFLAASLESGLGTNRSSASSSGSKNKMN